MESSRTSLASRTSSRTHFEVLGLGLEGQVLGLEASSPRKLPCPWLEDSTIFEQLKFRWKTPETSQKICEHLFCFPHFEHRRSQGEGGRGSAPSPIEISPMTKCDKKAYSFFSFSFFLASFAYNSITNNNIKDQGLRVSLNSIFASQFKCITRRKQRVFVLKIAISGPHLAFL